MAFPNARGSALSPREGSLPTPRFTCTEKRVIENGVVRSISIYMDVEAGGKPLDTFVLDTGSMETGNRLAALLNEAVVDILPIWRHMSKEQLYGN